MYFCFMQFLCTKDAFFCRVLKKMINCLRLLPKYMLKQERQAFILHSVNLHNKVLSSDLSTTIKVSEDTIRRDLQELSEANKLIKVHGEDTIEAISGEIASIIDSKKNSKLANA